MAKRLVKGSVYPLVNEDGSISLGPDNKVASLGVDGKVPVTQLPFDGVTKITVGTQEPSNPSVGDLWIDTN